MEMKIYHLMNLFLLLVDIKTTRINKLSQLQTPQIKDPEQGRIGEKSLSQRKRVSIVVET